MDINNDIQDIDNQLAKKGIPISARPLHAVMEFGKKHKISLPLAAGPSIVPDKDLPYPKENEKYTEFIHNWYDEVYGDRTKHDFSPGKIVLMIQNTPWQMNIPLVYGGIIPVMDISLEDKGSNKISSKGLPEFNILTCIQNITKDFANRLNKPELTYIYKRFMIALDVCHDLKNRHGAKYMSQAHSDLLASVEHIMRGKPDFGQSIWSTLQFTEKYAKSLLTHHDIEFPYSHSMKKLLDLLPTQEEHDYSKFIEKIQCSHRVRYGEEKSNLTQAINAHEKAVDLVNNLRKHWS